MTKSIFRATAILSASSIVSILLGFVSAKVLAVTLQPAGYGYYGLLQGFIGLMTLVMGFGMSTGLVRLGAGAVTRNDQSTLTSLRLGAWVLFAAISAVTLVLLCLFRVKLSNWALGTPTHGTAIVLMGIGLLFTVAATVQTGILNAYHFVGALAKNSVLCTLFTGVTTIGAVLIWGIRGLVPAILAGAVFSWLISSRFVKSKIGPLPFRPSRADTLKAALQLLKFGGPYTASLLVGTGIQFVMPILILHVLDTNSVGYYKAASAISVGYMGFLVAAMGQDYYPRTSAVADQPEKLATLVNQQHRLVMLIAIPMVLGMLALVPVLVPIVYSHKFTPTVDILEWQLIGDIFKFSSWTMSFAILARCSSSVYFMTELIGGISSLFTTWLAVRWFGLAGLGIGFLAAYVIYYLTVWVVIRREIHLTWTTRNVQMMVGAVTAATIVRLLPATRFASLRTPVALTMALIVGIPSAYVIWREFGGLKRQKVVALTPEEQVVVTAAE